MQRFICLQFAKQNKERKLKLGNTSGYNSPHLLMRDGSESEKNGNSIEEILMRMLSPRRAGTISPDHLSCRTLSLETTSGI